MKSTSLKNLRNYHRALADVTRLQIVSLLSSHGRTSVNSLIRALGRGHTVSQPLISWHLHKLRKAGLITTLKIGREVYCSLNQDKLLQFRREQEALLGKPFPSESVVVEGLEGEAQV